MRRWQGTLKKLMQTVLEWEEEEEEEGSLIKEVKRQPEIPGSREQTKSVECRDSLSVRVQNLQRALSLVSSYSCSVLSS